MAVIGARLIGAGHASAGKQACDRRPSGARFLPFRRVDREPLIGRSDQHKRG